MPTAVPVLPVSDLDRALAFYRRLGFEVVQTYPDYALCAFEGAEVHLVRFDDVVAATSLSGCYLRVDDAHAIHARWIATGAREISPPTDQPYGITEFATEDPDGNLWRVGSPTP